mgnify:CR=1 FL=1
MEKTPIHVSKSKLGTLNANLLFDSDDSTELEEFGAFLFVAWNTIEVWIPSCYEMGMRVL